jgi:glycosyltransferase involved in cell wall biosynthesis
MKNKLMMWIPARQCNTFYRKADGLIAISPGFKNNLISRGIAREKIEVVYNCCDEKSMQPVGPIAGEASDPFVILFAGNMGIMQSLGTVLEAAQILRTKGKNIRFRLIGAGIEVDHLRSQAADMALDNVEFLPSVSPKEITLPIYFTLTFTIIESVYL